MSTFAPRNTPTGRFVRLGTAVAIAAAVAACQTSYEQPVAEDAAIPERPAAEPAATNTPPKETATAPAFPPADAEAELAAIHAKFVKPRRKVQIEYDLHLRGCRRGYLAALSQLESDHRYAGDLDGADIVVAERQRFARGKAPTPEQRQQMMPRLRDARSQYEQNVARASFLRRRDETKIQIMYLREVEDLEKRLVRRGDLDAARIVEDERQRIRRILAEFAAELTIAGME